MFCVSMGVSFGFVVVSIEGVFFSIWLGLAVGRLLGLAVGRLLGLAVGTLLGGDAAEHWYDGLSTVFIGIAPPTTLTQPIAP
jgi:hypothetical protein